jgi:hypothetical protein
LGDIGALRTRPLVRGQDGGDPCRQPQRGIGAVAKDDTNYHEAGDGPGVYGKSGNAHGAGLQWRALETSV